jgi:hypothetical protein
VHPNIPTGRNACKNRKANAFTDIHMKYKELMDKKPPCKQNCV